MSSVSGDSERKNSHLSVGAVPMMSEGGLMRRPLLIMHSFPYSLPPAT